MRLHLIEWREPVRCSPCTRQGMFFDSWFSLWRTVVAGAVTYAALVMILRVSGKRTLATMNAFDLVVTVALGSTLSSVLVSREVPILDGVLALTLLVGLQFVVAWSSVRSRRVEAVVKSGPSLLVYRGERRAESMRANRVSDEEIEAAARSEGLVGASAAGAILLETNGRFSVIPMEALPPAHDPRTWTQV